VLGIEAVVVVDLKENGRQLLQAWMEIYGELTPEFQETFLTHEVVMKLAGRESPEMVWPCLKKHKKLNDIYACVQLSDEATNVTKEYIRKSRSRSIAKSLNPTSGGEVRPLRKSREPLEKEMRQRATPDFDDRNREPYL
jgi:hypothetical protein